MQSRPDQQAQGLGLFTTARKIWTAATQLELPTTVAFVMSSVGALFLAGCSLMSPYIEAPTAMDLVPASHSSDRVAACANPYEDLLYPCVLKDQLEAASRHQSWLESGTGLTLIPLAGLIGYRAVSNSAGKGVAALTAAGIAGYGVSTLFGNKQYVTEYETGAKAISCMIERTRGNFIPSLGRLQDLHDRALAARIEVDREGAQIQRSCRADNRISQARIRATQVQKGYAQTNSDLTKLESHNEFAARELRSAAESVRTKINQRLGGEAPDLKVIAALTPIFAPPSTKADGPVGKEHQQPSPQMAPPARGPQPASDPVPCDATVFIAAVADFEVAEAKFEDAIRPLAAHFTDETGDTLGAACPLSPADAVPPLEMIDTSASKTKEGAIVLANGRTFTALLHGGEPPYHAALSSSISSGDIAVQVITEGSGTYLSIRVGPNASATASLPFKVVIEDAKKRTIVRSFEVKKKVVKKRVAPPQNPHTP